MNILKEADKIVNKRAEEKERMYGPFSESMGKTALVATVLCNKEITTEDVYLILTALKLSRHSYGCKDDSLKSRSISTI